MAKTKVLLTGNEAVAEGAIQAGCHFYAGYPITPQNEIIAYMARRMPEEGNVFIQAESELAAINMVFGAAACGTRAMTSSSSPGISLKQEGISYLAGAELPALIINVMRAGPGLGNIFPAQSDYFQATKGGGQGDYRCIVLAPYCVQEAYDLVGLGFELADKYRNPALILMDGLLGQMAEPVQLSVVSCQLSDKNNLKTKNRQPKTKQWAVSGCKGRTRNIVKSFYMLEGDLEKLNLVLQKKYRNIQQKEQRWEAESLKDAGIILVAYGTMARIAKSAVNRLRQKGKKIGLVRPISLWPFPNNIFRHLTLSRKKLTILVLEMSYGQMVEDVKLAVGGKFPVEFLGRSGGGIPSEKEIINKINRLVY